MVPLSNPRTPIGMIGRPVFAPYSLSFSQAASHSVTFFGSAVLPVACSYKSALM